MPLTDIKIRSAKPKEKTFKLFDSVVASIWRLARAGGKYWRWKYRFAGKEKRLAFGVYPGCDFKDGREKRDAARQQLGAGIDPGEARKAEKIAQAGAESFEAIAREWYAKVFTRMGGKSCRSNPTSARKRSVSLAGHSTCQRRRLSFYDREWALI